MGPGGATGEVSSGEGGEDGGAPTVFFAPLSESLPLVRGGDVEDVANNGPPARAGWVWEPPPRLDEAVDEKEDDSDCDELFEGNWGVHLCKSQR